MHMTQLVRTVQPSILLTFSFVAQILRRHRVLIFDRSISVALLELYSICARSVVHMHISILKKHYKCIPAAVNDHTLSPTSYDVLDVL